MVNFGLLVLFLFLFVFELWRQTVPRAETTMCDFSDYVASYDEAIDVVRQYEDACD